MRIDGMPGIQGAANVSEKVHVESTPVKGKNVEAVKPVVGSGAAKFDGTEVITDDMLDKAMEAANKTLAKHNNVIERSVHDVTKTVMYVMKDTETDEVIKEFPPKKIQDMIAKMWELAGLFVDEKA